jgi:hypothetical protein
VYSAITVSNHFTGGVAYEKIHIQDEQMSALTYSAGHPQFFAGYALKLSKNIFDVAGSYGYAMVYSPKSVDGVPYVNLKCFDMYLRWQRELIQIVPAGLIFAGGTTISYMYVDKEFSFNNITVNYLDYTAFSAGLNLSLELKLKRNGLKINLNMPLLFYVTRLNEFCHFYSEFKSFPAVKQFSCNMVYTYNFNTLIGASLYYELRVLRYNDSFQLNIGSDRFGFLLGINLYRKAKNNKTL